MNNWPLPKHVFISQAHMIRYGGSEIVTLELAEYFSSLGSKVTIGTWAVGNPMMGHLKSNDKIQYFDIDDDRLQEILISDPPQLAWIHHQIIPRQLLQESSGCAFVFNHMSSTHPLEFSWSQSEAELASVHLYNSRETLERQNADGLVDSFNPDRLKIFANPAPDEFRSIDSKSCGDVKRIGIVTNHLPAELNDVIQSPPAGIEFIRVGYSEGGESIPARVTPSLIASFDGVVTIGKTVQYALLGGIPVYCYDHLGGPGWLGAENFTLAETNNFSGRGFDRKSPDSIRCEVVEGFSRAQEFAESLRDASLARFTLSSSISEVLNIIGELGTPTKAFSGPQARAHLSQQKVVGHYVRNWLRASGDSGTPSLQKKTVAKQSQPPAGSQGLTSTDITVDSEVFAPSFLSFMRQRFVNSRQHDPEDPIPWELDDKYRAYEYVKQAGYAVPRHVKTSSAHDALAAGESFGERFVVKQPNRHSAMGVYVLEKLGGGRYLELLSLRVVTAADLQPVGAEPEYWLAEECIDSGIEGMPIPFDYKIYAFRGKVTHVNQIDRNVSPPRMTLFDGAFIPLELGKDFTINEQRWLHGNHVIPRHAGAMLEMAATLSSGIDTKFVKVDCFDGPEGPVFGEFTFASGGDDTGMMRYSQPILAKLDQALDGSDVGALSGFDIDMPKFRDSLDQRPTINATAAHYSRISAGAARGDRRYALSLSSCIQAGAPRLVFLIGGNVIGCLNGDGSRAFSIQKCLREGSQLITGHARLDEFVSKALAFHDPKAKGNPWHTARAAEVRLSAGDMGAFEVLRSLAADGYSYAAQIVRNLEKAESAFAIRSTTANT